MSGRKKPAQNDMTPSELIAAGRPSVEDFARIGEGSEEALAAAKLRAERAAAPRGEGIPPTVTRGEHGTAGTPGTHKLVLSNGKTKIVETRTGRNGNVGFIDWLNFTFHETTAHGLGRGVQISDDDIIRVLSQKLHNIFGFGVTRACEKGRNFYARSWELGDGLGFICHGGQRNTVLVMLNGTGLTAAADGWEMRLHKFLTETAQSPRITRVDIAHDCFQGEYTVDRAKADWESGAFKLAKSPSNPDCEMRGNWLKINGKGRSFYVGQRTSGKYLRVYEKGMQLGAPDSPWVRVEVEVKSVDRVIPFDVILNPGAYLAGAYPALEWISEAQERIVTLRKTKQIERSAKERWMHTVCGPDLAVLLQLEQGESEEIRAHRLVLRLMNETRLPKWVSLPQDLRGDDYIHDELTRAADCVPAGYDEIADAFQMELERNAI